MKEYKVIKQSTYDETNQKKIKKYTYEEFAKKIEDTLNFYAKKGYKVINTEAKVDEHSGINVFFFVLEREI